MESTTKVIIPCRLSYANVWTPDVENGKYSCSLIIKPDKKVIAKIEKAIANAKASDPVLAKMKTCKQPLRNADDEGREDPAYQGMYFLNASSKYAPGIVDRRVQPILDQSEVYSGCYCNVSINFYPYNSDGNKGVAAGLNNIQKVKDGERLSGAASAAEDFEALEDEDDEDELFD